MMSFYLQEVLLVSPWVHLFQSELPKKLTHLQYPQHDKLCTFLWFFLSVVFNIYELKLLYFECYSNICFAIYWNTNDYSCGFWNRVNQKSNFQLFYIRTVFRTTVQLSMCCGSLLLVINHWWHINCLLLKQLSIIHRVYQTAIWLIKCWLEVLDLCANMYLIQVYLWYYVISITSIYGTGGYLGLFIKEWFPQSNVVLEPPFFLT